MKPEDIKLVSDFHDYYDHNFAYGPYAKTKHQLNRNSNNGMHKYTQLYLMKTLGFTVPPNGTVESLLDQFPYPELVVYTDPFLHRGEGKELISAKHAINKYPDLFAIPYIENSNSILGSVTIRILWIGDVGFELQYSSGHYWKGDWRSNYGDEVHIKLISTMYINRPQANYPLFAIDLIEDIVGKRWAIDFNTAPGIKDTPIQDLYQPRQIAQFIADWYDKVE